MHYIIVGSGSAGATLAARLTEDAANRVTLVEAGPDMRTADRPLEMVAPNPSAVIRLEKFVQFCQFPDLLARRTRRQQPRRYWRGRILGGSSAINGQIAIRGMLDDFDLWAAAGCDGWSGADVAPFFNRLETDLDYGDAPWHGDSGPIPVRRAPQERWGAVDKAVCAAALGLGYGWADDHNAPDATGVSPYAINNTPDERRVSCADGYLEPIRGRANLEIVTGALVDRLILEGNRPSAKGVMLAPGNGQEGRRILGDEVILCAGACHTPTILMRSGIGPADLLADLGIAPVQVLPVGLNFQDHPLAGFLLELKPEARPASPYERHTNITVRYSSGMCGGGRNDMKLMALNQMGDSMMRMVTADENAGAQGVKAIIGATVQQSFSCGTLRISSRDPHVDPEIDENMLGDERDLVRMRDGVRRLMALAASAPIQAIASRITIGFGEEGIDALTDDDAIDAWLLEQVSDGQHATGTCRMGPADDPRSVVTPDCRVIGVDRLRVVDASIMPAIVRANTHLSTVMIGERMADRIRREAGATA
ncbi:GMC family oxidoreductase [Stella sp.]|uniref:GMC family oxidoreductase n=1 Tax=Stella sp. TaxID=2912054 RepID=UPI0035B3715B